MDPQNQVTQQLDPRQKVNNALTTMQPGETVLCTINRHPVGIIGVYAVIGVVVAVIAGLAFGLAPSFSTGNDNQAMAVGVVIFFVASIIAVIYALVATKVYWGNSWVITSDSVTQVQQRSLFSRQSSQLSLANLEDVTAEQNGILSHMFNFGVLKAETAGEHSKFMFPFCPNPNFYAQQILRAREVFEQRIDQEGGQPGGVNTNTQ
jgi:hypothetical protein